MATEEGTQPFNQMSDMKSDAATERGRPSRLKRLRIPKNRFTKMFSSPDHVQVFLTVLSVILGVVIGLSVRASNDKFTKKQIKWIGFPGEMLMNMLKMLIIPLIVSSLISGSSPHSSLPNNQ
ncbi:Neutral amino acid transporter B(0) [Cichlidogyrus casuarinus]|uniref:Amino acid transporter n=1 Tax=Cichlidogyrus casuarinus TaxID=1844966 RepID=A0ABD2PPI2_9PLAT